jgi:hypothetical protein
MVAMVDSSDASLLGMKVSGGMEALGELKGGGMVA